MPIKIVKRAFSIELDIKPLLEKAGYKIKNIGHYSWGHWEINRHTELWLEPMRPEHLGLKIVGPDALEIAKVIEKEFPKLDLRVTETERPQPGFLCRFFKW